MLPVFKHYKIFGPKNKFPRLSLISAIFHKIHDFLGLENSLSNSMTFHHDFHEHMDPVMPPLVQMYFRPFLYFTQRLVLKKTVFLRGRVR